MRGTRCIPILFVLAVLTTGCPRHHPDDPKPDPCAALVARPLSISFIERFGTPTPDTANSGQDITFEAAGRYYTSWRWKIGTDPREQTGQRVSLYFRPTEFGRLTVQLIGTRAPNTACDPKDDGIDTVQRTLVLMPYAAIARAPILGRFHGYNLDAPRDTFTVRIFQAPRYPTPVEEDYTYIRNLGQGCQSPYFEAPVSWRGVTFNYGGSDFGCLTEAGNGYLTSRDSIRFEYYQFKYFNSLERVNRVFVGRRVR